MKLSKENKDITVSICVITYNQENIIGDVLNYLINQQTDFNFEIVIGEDCSTDNTRNICKDYKNLYPDTINLLLNHENLGLIGNFSKVISKCSGKYIAICAGDDFWIDPQKLQKQVDFLEQNPDFSMCSSEAYYNKVGTKNLLKGFLSILYNNFRQDGLKVSFNIFLEFFVDNDLFWKKRRQPTSIKRPSVGTLKTVLRDLTTSRYYAASANIIRREVAELIPQETYNLKSEHIIIILWAALNGKIKLFKEVMIVKNDLPTSITSNKLMQKIYKPENVTKGYIKLLEIAKEQISDHEKIKLLNNKIEELNG